MLAVEPLKTKLAEQTSGPHSEVLWLRVEFKDRVFISVTLHPPHLSFCALSERAFASSKVLLLVLLVCLFEPWLKLSM